MKKPIKKAAAPKKGGKPKMKLPGLSIEPSTPKKRRSC